MLYSLSASHIFNIMPSIHVDNKKKNSFKIMIIIIFIYTLTGVNLGWLLTHDPDPIMGLPPSWILKLW